MSSENQTVTEVSQYQEHHLVTIVLLCSIYGLLSLTAFLGNMALIWIICESISMRVLFGCCVNA